MDTNSSGARTEVPMLRKLIFVVSAVAFTLASCGRQVTPNRTEAPSGLSSGQMQIKFSTQGTLDFVNNWYVLAFNTSGTGTEPYAKFGNQAQNWLDFSFEIIVYQPNASSAVQAQLFQFGSTSGPNGPQKQPVRINVVNPQDLIVTPNCNGNQTQFCITLNRRIFITTFPFSSPSPGPSGTPMPGGVADSWFINWFVAQPGGNPSGQVVSAAGPFGVTDNTFVQQYDVTATFDTPWTQAQPPAVPQAPSAASQIVGGEVLNSP
jgi:hypothetical protein